MTHKIYNSFIILTKKNRRILKAQWGKFSADKGRYILNPKKPHQNFGKVSRYLSVKNLLLML